MIDCTVCRLYCSVAANNRGYRVCLDICSTIRCCAAVDSCATPCPGTAAAHCGGRAYDAEVRCRNCGQCLAVSCTAGAVAYEGYRFSTVAGDHSGGICDAADRAPAGAADARCIAAVGSHCERCCRAVIDCAADRFDRPAAAHCQCYRVAFNRKVSSNCAVSGHRVCCICCAD